MTDTALCPSCNTENELVELPSSSTKQKRLGFMCSQCGTVKITSRVKVDAPLFTPIDPKHYQKSIIPSGILLGLSCLYQMFEIAREHAIVWEENRFGHLRRAVQISNEDIQILKDKKPSDEEVVIKGRFKDLSND